jgi:hypothetical protein
MAIRRWLVNGHVQLKTKSYALDLPTQRITAGSTIGALRETLAGWRKAPIWKQSIKGKQLESITIKLTNLGVSE